MKQNKGNIYVIYIGVNGVRSEDIKSYCNLIADKISPTTIEGEVIVIPVNRVDTRIECINPVYITKKELVDEHTKKMEFLLEEINNQINSINDEKN